MVTPARKITDPKLRAEPQRGQGGLRPPPPGPLFLPQPPALLAGRRHQPYFYRHLGIYAYQVGFLQKFVHLAPGRWEEAEKLEQLRALEHGYPIHIVETAGDTLEVDTPADLARAEAYFAPGS